MKGRVVYYVLGSLFYLIFYKLVGFEIAVIVALGTIVGEQIRIDNQTISK